MTKIIKINKRKTDNKKKRKETDKDDITKIKKMIQRREVIQR